MNERKKRDENRFYFLVQGRAFDKNRTFAVVVAIYIITLEVVNVFAHTQSHREVLFSIALLCSSIYSFFCHSSRAQRNSYV